MEYFQLAIGVIAVVLLMIFISWLDKVLTALDVRRANDKKKNH